MPRGASPAQQHEDRDDGDEQDEPADDRGAATTHRRWIGRRLGGSADSRAVPRRALRIADAGPGQAHGAADAALAESEGGAGPADAEAGTGSREVDPQALGEADRRAIAEAHPYASVRIDTVFRTAPSFNMRNPFASAACL